MRAGDEDVDGHSEKARRFRCSARNFLWSTFPGCVCSLSKKSITTRVSQPAHYANDFLSFGSKISLRTAHPMLSSKKTRIAYEGLRMVPS